jgi:hypothetical protein
MKTVYIHIGTFKTGTTSIQHFLKDNRKALERRGVYIPSTKILAHHTLPLSLIKKYSNWRGGWREFDGGPDEIWGTLVEEIEATDCEKVLVSSESFCDLVNENCRAKSEFFAEYLKKRLKAYDVKIICYLRSIEPYLRGVYQESIKITSATVSLADEIDILFRRDSIHTKPSIYLDFYAQIFGEENILVREYSSDSLLEGDSVKDFLNIFGCSDLYEAGGEIRSNPSLSGKQISYKRALNAYAPDSYPLHQELATLLHLVNEISGSEDYECSLPDTIIAEINSEQEKLAAQYSIHLEPAERRPLKESEKKTGLDYELLVLSLLSKIIAQNELLLGENNVNLKQRKYSRWKEKIRKFLGRSDGK